MMLRKKEPAITNTEKVVPYAVLAEIYDYVMRHVDYVEWSDYIEDVFARFSHGLTPRSITEVACGTGTLALEMASRGYHVHGMDLSQHMIDRARAKAAKFDDPETPPPTFAVHDMRDLPDGNADAVLCLYDSINYCMNEDELKTTISGLLRLVRPGGLCVFDFTTETNSLRYFEDSKYHDRGRGVYYERHSAYDKEQKLQTNTFRFRRGDDSDGFTEQHIQRIYALSAFRAAVDTDSCYILGAFDDFSFEPASDESERIHMVLRKNDQV